MPLLSTVALNKELESHLKGPHSADSYSCGIALKLKHNLSRVGCLDAAEMKLFIELRRQILEDVLGTR